MSCRHRKAVEGSWRPQTRESSAPEDSSSAFTPWAAGPYPQVIARKYVATAAAEGQWVLLQNTHLGLGYLSEVEAVLTKTEELHESFR